MRAAASRVNHAALGQCLRRGEFDFEPALELAFVRPDAAHLFSCVAGNHGRWDCRVSVRVLQRLQRGEDKNVSGLRQKLADDLSYNFVWYTFAAEDSATTMHINEGENT